MTALPAITIELGPDAQRTIDVVREFGTAAIDGARKGLVRAMKGAEARATRLARNDRVRVRSGSFIRSIVGGVRDGEDGFPVGFLGFRRGLVDRYAAAQELGTVGAGGELPDIRPVNAKALAVPLPAALDRRGIPLYSGPMDPALQGQLFMIERIGRPPILARTLDAGGLTKRHGRGGSGGERIEPLFVLLKSVKLRPRRVLREAMIESLADAQRDVSEAIARELRRRGGDA